MISSILAIARAIGHRARRDVQGATGFSAAGAHDVALLEAPGSLSSSAEWSAEAALHHPFEQPPDSRTRPFSGTRYRRTRRRLAWEDSGLWTERRILGLPSKTAYGLAQSVPRDAP
ncbi:uncharacterized protein N7459_002397 [Penicillium hispanicum]|uniref:uncharacterized protein n=1 Tax=Penicillium hispanicum TaxID=1080232 RepID=UPI002540ADB7|nr:uncharacterized protein N7459_002397 [Penicillium hispanicum]KAJ5592028.1 hypothetical protein N7459_002397 [Penicillium hispanicum]